MRVPFVPLGDKKKRLDGQVIGSGTAWVSTNGKTVKGTWRKKSFTSPTRFYGPDGKQLPLTIGQTFIQVVPKSTKITIQPGKVAAPAPASPAASPSASTSLALGHPRPGGVDHAAGRTGPRPRSSSQRRPMTTNSASTMIRRLILDWPSRRSRKMIGTSTTRAPRRDAR